jgi:hypothetical protein
MVRITIAFPTAKEPTILGIQSAMIVASLEESFISSAAISSLVRVAMAKPFPAIASMTMIEPRLKERANQSLEPTSPSVTDRADARSAPAGAVAHL